MASVKIHYRGLKKGLEPLIAAIVLIAITIVIAIAVAGWTMGVFGATVSGSEQLLILPNATLKKENNVWYFSFTVTNKGQGDSEIIGVTVGNCSSSTFVNPSPPVVVESGSTKTISANMSAGACSYNNGNGNIYQASIITAAGNTFFTTVTAGT